MTIHKLIGGGRDYANKHATLDIRRGRFIVPTADLSALAAFHHTRRGRFIVPTADLSALRRFPMHAHQS
jgi:hypothetical protein